MSATAKEGKVKENKNVVMIEPLASIKAIEEFLWPILRIDSQLGYVRRIRHEYGVGVSVVTSCLEACVAL